MHTPIIYSAKTAYNPSGMIKTTATGSTLTVLSSTILEFNPDGKIYISTTTGQLSNSADIGSIGTNYPSNDTYYSWYSGGTPASGTWTIRIKATSRLYYDSISSYAGVRIYDGYINSGTTGVLVSTTTVVGGSGNVTLNGTSSGTTDIVTYLTGGSSEKIRIEVLCEQESAGTSYAWLDLNFSISDPAPTTATMSDDVNLGAIAQSTYVSGGGSGGGGCFLAGTPVLLADGTYKNIENIVAGDVVASESVSTIIDENDPNWMTWTADDATFKTSYLTSATVMDNKTFNMSEYYRINNTLCATGEHILFVKRNDVWQYSRVSDLVIGDILFTSSQTEISISSLELFSSGVTVYLLDVESNDCYFIGNENILVHNDKPVTDPF